jgi:dihydrofolate synthase/folylpolyglutamate synthase
MTNGHYDRCLSSMYGLRRFGIKLGLDTIEAILAALGHPQQNVPAIHVAGTNGKGSVVALLAAILRQAGYRVGHYTSPHLERFNERICIDAVPIDDREVVAAWEKIQAMDHLEREPTFFEATTAMALYEFSRRKVDWAIMETGMGGRLDATNVLQPALCVITNISLEHRDYLGHTIAAIAGEKAGIIKPKTPVVSGVTQYSALQVITRKAASQQAPLFQKSRDFRCRRQGDGTFSYYGMDGALKHLTLGLSGAHQVDNAALVLAACETLNRKGTAVISEAAIRAGLAAAQWHGRLEIVSQEPCIILDGAHNLMAARVLARHLAENYADRFITLVIGILDDKPCDAILKDLIRPCQRVVITQPVIDRAIPAEDLAERAKAFSSAIEIVPRVKDAVGHALNSSAPTDVICIAGSLYVVGEAKTALRKLGIG